MAQSFFQRSSGLQFKPSQHAHTGPLDSPKGLEKRRSSQQVEVPDPDEVCSPVLNLGCIAGAHHYCVPAKGDVVVDVPRADPKVNSNISIPEGNTSI
jgi:hypothetical protein